MEPRRLARANSDGGRRGAYWGYRRGCPDVRAEDATQESDPEGPPSRAAARAHGRGASAGRRRRRLERARRPGGEEGARVRRQGEARGREDGRRRDGGPGRGVQQSIAAGPRSEGEGTAYPRPDQIPRQTDRGAAHRRGRRGRGRDLLVV